MLTPGCAPNAALILGVDEVWHGANWSCILVLIHYSGISIAFAQLGGHLLLDPHCKRSQVMALGDLTELPLTHLTWFHQDQLADPAAVPRDFHAIALGATQMCMAVQLRRAFPDGSAGYVKVVTLQDY